ncbi:acyl-CoA N-acyltransferase [Aulographum hederae CBS 113979]|uniref:Acyl-CoA N-acyltransferase n=1 Tax=Aulographum hederae CBS 113979 TaxID=1176131 RepID=A0A6G1GRH5_9PEZI|nr:acyl-CoA N-acyltransferase [Aulographum hederae CBS 113979]
MPRDLSFETQDDTVNGMPPLQRSAANDSSSSDRGRGSDNDGSEPVDFLQKNMRREDEMMKLHPYGESLTLKDVDSCVLLENACFEPHERATPEKIEYRITKCSGLCMGIFSTATPSTENPSLISAATASTAHAPSNATPENKSILLAHLIATKTTNPDVRDEDMAYPSDWRTNQSPDPSIGHREHGRTVAVHSLAVLPTHQGKGLGKMLMKTFIQRVHDSQAADRVALLTFDHLVPYYESLGFECKGRSEATFGGGNWNSMVKDLTSEQPQRPAAS